MADRRQRDATGTRPRARKRQTTARVVAKQQAFLEAYAGVGVITAAAKISGVLRKFHYEWLKADPGYRQRFADAHEQACDRLETEAVRRAVQGWEEPVFGRGEVSQIKSGRKLRSIYGTIQVGTVKRYSDRLLEMLLKARRPGRFRERHSHEHSGPKGKPIQTETHARVAFYIPDNGRRAPTK